MDKIAETDHADPLYAPSLTFECPYRWSDMKGDARVRFCSACQKNVYNISEMNRRDAVAFIVEQEGESCVRFYKRKDGTIVTRDCFTILGTARLRAKYPFLAAVNAGISAFLLAVLPLLGPACVTIVGGVGPMISDKPVEAEVVEEPKNKFQLPEFPRLNLLERWFSDLMHKP